MMTSDNGFLLWATLYIDYTGWYTEAQCDANRFSSDATCHIFSSNL